MKKKLPIKRIIVDGLDGAGKTTLIKQLKEKYPDIEVEHETKDTCYAIKGYKKKLKKRRYILDRSFLSEIVYTEVFHREKCALTGLEQTELTQQMINDNVLVIICMNTPESAQKIFNERKEVCDHNYPYAIKAWNHFIKYLLGYKANVKVYNLNEVMEGKEYEWLKEL